uniref:UBA domain-containing protein n=1 Tax=Mantoniella antarctica TaxID=81844 RepID=A0A7S0SAN5_9CHLO|mmetsp:Transcript_15084/g.37065  ORF Transcript_15084/g.37065 Transcript_15084/m.37065 type:complete len:239 (+) Transcript_15084:202-918(+)
MMRRRPVVAVVVALACVLVQLRGAAADVAVFSSNSGVTLPVVRTFDPEDKLVQGLIQAGFPQARAEAALRAVGNENCCQPQMKWLFDQSRAANAARRTPRSSQCNKHDNTDYDGFAVKWGGQNIQASWEACCQSCHDYVPVSPNFYACNIWVFCAHDECFAPAAGEFKRGQCWLKYQEARRCVGHTSAPATQVSNLDNKGSRCTRTLDGLLNISNLLHSGRTGRCARGAMKPPPPPTM